MLPLVVAGLIGFTYVFVNALPAAEVTPAPDAGASTTTSTTASPTSSTTTTTLDPAVVAFLGETRNIEENVTALGDLAQQINDAWDTDSAEFSDTRDAMEDLEVQTTTLANTVGEVDAPPSIEEWQDVLDQLGAMEQAAADMIDGFLNSAGSEDRLSALEDYKIAVAAATNALAEVRQAVRNPAS